MVDRALEPSRTDSIGSNVVELIDRKLKTAFSSNTKVIQSRETLELILIEAEVLSGFGQPLRGLSVLNAGYDSLVLKGLREEYLRLTKKCLSQIDWSSNIHDSPELTNSISIFIRELGRFGEFPEAELYLDKYENSLEGRSAQYINLCDLRSAIYRLSGNLTEAIKWGARGKALVEDTSADTRYSSEHNWALAARDGGKPHETLDYFLDGYDLQHVLSPDFAESPRIPASVYFGNLGRCLQLMGRTSDALILYRRSLKLLQPTRKDRNQATTEAYQNLGYANFWTGEAQQQLEHHFEAICFYRIAKEWWDLNAPALSEKADAAIMQFSGTNDQRAIEALRASQKKCQKVIDEWLKGIK